MHRKIAEDLVAMFSAFSHTFSGFTPNTLNLMTLINANRKASSQETSLFCQNVPPLVYMVWFISLVLEFLHLISLYMYSVGLFASCFGREVIQKLCSVNDCCLCVCGWHWSLHTSVMKHNCLLSSWSKIKEYPFHQNTHPLCPLTIDAHLVHTWSLNAACRGKSSLFSFQGRAKDRAVETVCVDQRSCRQDI